MPHIERRGLILLAASVVLGIVTALLLVNSQTGTRAASSETQKPPGTATRAGKPVATKDQNVDGTSGSAGAAKAKTASKPAPKPKKGQRLLTIVNHTKQTVWPAVAADPAHPVAATGWRLAPGKSVAIVIPDHWNVRVWARTGCVFNAKGHGHCVTGDCGGHFQCGRQWGALPATLAEFNLNAWRGMDFYDVSLVDGSNLPMYINHSGGHTPDKISPRGCVAAGCTHDANTTCPRRLQVTSAGRVVACRSACVALNTDQTCCRGRWAPRAKCVPADWPIDSAAIFKRAEPFAYSYVDDDATSVFTCTGECDYRITFGRTN